LLRKQQHRGGGNRFWFFHSSLNTFTPP
jgi:hypothetical protein